MNEETHCDITYVLFGKEAILTYKISAQSLLDNNIEYKVGAYTSVKSFVNESHKWDGFIEISPQDYDLLKPKQQGDEQKKSLLKKLFKR